jgi:hypothetical protein
MRKPTTCEYCRRADGSVVNHHVLGRRYRHLVDDPDNLVPLCLEHHTQSSWFSAHLTPAEFKKWIISHRGDEWWERLLKKKQRHPKDGS